MKRFSRHLALLALLLSFGMAAMATSPDAAKKRLRRFLKKKDLPSRVELVVGGYGEFADRRGKKDHFHPFGDFQIGVKVYTEDNRVYGTAGIGGGVFSWDNFRVEVVGGQFAHNLLNRSRVSIGHPDQVPGHRVRLRITMPGFPGFSREVELPLDFSYSYTLAAAGITGTDGWEACGRASEGSDGRAHEKCDGESGEDGYHGRNGAHGYPGAPGPDLEVTLLPYDDLNSDDLVIEAREKNLLTGRTRTRWFKPGVATLAVISRGGSGGDGGDGQPGGHGGDGGDGGRKGSEKVKPILAYGGHGGHGGHGGMGGDGGPGGPGGQVYVYYHPDLLPHLKSIEIKSLGGFGGDGGRGGAGGKGGCAGKGTKGDGQAGTKGECGPSGYDGPRGMAGPPAQWIALDI